MLRRFRDWRKRDLILAPIEDVPLPLLPEEEAPEPADIVANVHNYPPNTITQPSSLISLPAHVCVPCEDQRHFGCAGRDWCLCPHDQVPVDSLWAHRDPEKTSVMCVTRLFYLTPDGSEAAYGWTVEARRVRASRTTTGAYVNAGGKPFVGDFNQFLANFRRLH